MDRARPQWPGADTTVDSPEAGLSMMEIAFAMAIMMVVLVMGLRATGSLLGVESQAVSKGQSTTEVVVALDQLRQEIVSANVIFDPANDYSTQVVHGVPTNVNYAGSNADGTQIKQGWSLRVYTQLNGVPMCVQWRLLDTGALQTRTWSNFWQTGGAVHPWSTLAGNVVNASGYAPFSLDHAANYGGTSSRLIDVSLYASTGNKHVNPVLVQTSIAARDAEYYPANTGVCSPIPTP